MSNMIRTLIVDDEPLARERLRQLLGQHPEIELLGECSDGAEALRKIRESSPDLVFLDIQMPELDGFQVVAALEQPPAIIFCTAHDKFALKAFDVHAIDYLLKPFDRSRFEKALKRGVDQIKARQGNKIDQRLTALLDEMKPQAKNQERLAVKTDGRVILVKFEDIDWLEADDNYVKIHVGAECHMVRDTMSAMEQKLTGKQFVRVSRSTIVNLDRIKELQPLFHGEYVIILRTGARLNLTRGYKDKLRFLLPGAQS
jgi:two-component system LytT family response regulator